jgi:hypothetical protein
MQVIGILFLVIIVIYNLTVTLINLLRVVGHCVSARSIGDFWSLYFGSSFSLGSIISSLLGLAIAIVVFIVLALYIAVQRKPAYAMSGGSSTSSSNIRGGRFDARYAAAKSLPFSYSKIDLTGKPKALFYSNLNSIGLDNPTMNFFGELKLDVMAMALEVLDSANKKNINLDYKVMEVLFLKDKKETTIPLLLDMSGKLIPTFFLYTKEHQDIYKQMIPLLEASGFDKHIYFSLDPL